MLNIIKRFVKGIELNKKVFKGISNDDNRIFFNNDEINIEGYILRKNNRQLAMHGISVAGLNLVQFGFSYVPCIIIDDIFNELSKDTQDFILQHELGHFTYHQEQLLKGYERNDNMEFEADAYASRIVGVENSIKALEELKDYVSLLSFGLNKKGIREINNRINYMKSLA